MVEEAKFIIKLISGNDSYSFEVCGKKNAINKAKNIEAKKIIVLNEDEGVVWQNFTQE